MPRIAKNLNPWARAKKLTLLRTSPCGIYSEPLDKGVNYFVLMLEQLGARTHYSCSGHAASPKSFYVVFSAPLELAQDIRAAGFFNVELERSQDDSEPTWSLRTHSIETDRDRINVLSLASIQWERVFGPSWDAEA